MDYRLGLDIGTNSIGWALWKTKDGKPIDLLDIGVRIFSDGCDAKSGQSLAVARRTARHARRLRMRWKNRQNALLNLLRQSNLLPEDKEDFKKILDRTDPYKLRYDALRRGLHPCELGRVLYQLGQRRGFKSNRKLSAQDEGGDTAKEEKESMTAIGKLKEAMREMQIAEGMDRSITLGEFLYLQKKRGVRIRFGKQSPWRADRAMYAKEWDKIENAQKGFNAEFATLPWERMKKFVFFQRPLQSQERGKCTLYPNEARGCKALPSFQNFRILQTLHDLEYQTPTKRFTLSNEDIRIMYGHLQACKTMSFDKVAHKLRFPKGGKFNFESKKRKAISGNETRYEMCKPGHLKEYWDDFDSEEQDRLIEWLLSAMQEDWKRAEEWMRERGIGDENIQAVMQATLPSGVGRLSSLAMRNLSTRMLDCGENYTEACIALGAHHSDFAYNHNKNGLYDELPYYGKILSRSCMAVPMRLGKKIDSEEEEYGKIGNPRVHVALRQLQRVVNAIIKRYGRPAFITVEVTRKLKNSRNSRKEIMDQQAKAQEDNKRINAFYHEMGIAHPSRADRQKYKLWEELQVGASHNCLYCGKNISCQQLLNAATEVDHILPFSQTLDDSMSNKTVVHQQCNQQKGNKTPFAAFASDVARWTAIKERLLSNPNLSNGKRNRFRENAMDRYKDQEAFFERHGNDTAYISRSAREYLATICPYGKIVVSPGILTDMLRGSLDLNRLLNNGSTNAKRKWTKNRFDHRHHAVDALVIGLLSPGYLNEMVRLNQNVKNLHRSVRKGNVRLETPPLPIGKERIEEMLDSTLVSFKPEHGSNGEFFNETAMGLSHKDRSVTYAELKEKDHILDDELRKALENRKVDTFEKKKKGLLQENRSLEHRMVTVRDFIWVTRKELLGLKEKEVDRIYDDDIKKKLTALKEAPGKWNEKLKSFAAKEGCRRIKFVPNVQKAFALPLEFPLQLIDAKTAFFRDVPVQKGYAPGEYCMCICWEMANKLIPHFYTYLELRLTTATNGELYKPHPAAKKRLQVFKQDVLRLEPKDGSSPYYVRVAGFAAGTNRFDLQPVYAVSNHAEWQAHTNQNRVNRRIDSNSPQNYKSISSLYKENLVRKAGLDVLGKPLFCR